MNFGFMQGRLSPQVDRKIQAFPVQHWREEFPAARDIGLRMMEWTLDHEGLSANPLMTDEGRAEIQTLSKEFHLSIPSLTGDCWMQAPFWKEADPAARRVLLGEFDEVADAASKAGIGILVIPLVDNGAIGSPSESAILRDALISRNDHLASKGIRIAFESDLPPRELAGWVEDYPTGTFGINYDTGNSAALGYHAGEEWAHYGSRVINVHIKDRVVGGGTAPLGSGACNFLDCFEAMRVAGYAGNMILQTARAEDGDDSGAIRCHLEFLSRIMKSSSIFS